MSNFAYSHVDAVAVLALLAGIVYLATRRPAAQTVFRCAELLLGFVLVIGAHGNGAPVLPRESFLPVLHGNDAGYLIAGALLLAHSVTPAAWKPQ